MPHPPPSTFPDSQALITTLRAALEVLQGDPSLRVAQELALHMGLTLLEAACTGIPGAERGHAPA
jgi:hypothetical protein